LIAAYNDKYSSRDVFEAGLILQGLGYAFIFSAALEFYTCTTNDGSSNNSSSPVSFISGFINKRRSSGGNANTDPSSKSQIAAILNIVNTVALILLIVGYTSSDSLFAQFPSPIATLSSTAKAGDVLFVIITAILGMLICHGVVDGRYKSKDSQIILFTIVTALPVMLLRAIFVTYQAFQPDPFGSLVILRIVLQYAAEALVEILFTMMGIYLLFHQKSSADIESAQQPASKHAEELITNDQNLAMK
jgi:hypothetical protein